MQGCIAYVGAIGGPEHGAGPRRILGVARAIAETGLTVRVGAGLLPEETRIECTVAAPSGEISFQGTGEYDFSWSKGKKLSHSLWLNGSKTVRWLDHLEASPRAVIVYGTSAPLLLRIRRWCRQRRIPLIADVVEWYYAGQVAGGALGPILWMNELSLRHIVPQCSGVITISRLLKEYYCSRQCRTIRIPPVCDTSSIEFGKLARDREIKLIYAGTPGKKDLILTIFRSLAVFNQSRKRAVFRMVGPTMNDLKWLMPEVELPYVQILGRKSHRDVLALVRDADFSVLARPQRRYANAGFPTKVVESMSCGTPVICNLTGDLGQHIKHGVNGIVCRSHTVDAFVEGLECAEALSTSEHSNMRKAARYHSEKVFDYRNYTDALGAFLVSCGVTGE